jgi:DNA adenine methylase
VRANSYNLSMSNECLPFLKWAGGKRKITSLLSESFPPEFHLNKGNYFEPFVGGGALALSLGNQRLEDGVTGTRININDMNPDLVKTYRVIRDSLPDLIHKLDSISSEFLGLGMPAEKTDEPGEENPEHPKSRADYFYEMRAHEPTSDIETAARLIFLNKTCFNGLWRVNSKGKFNVPYGHHKNPSLYDLANLKECSRRLQGAEITHLEFHEVVSSAKQYDLVYFDPPYIPLNPTSSFSQYSKNDFGLDDQEKLAKTIQDLTDRGVFVILSNSDTPQTREVFSGAVSLRRLLMSRFISASASKRNAVYEVIGTNFEAPKGSPLSELELI